MNSTEHDRENTQYMGNVKWITFLYGAFAIASLLIGGTFGVATLRADIKDAKIESREHYTNLRHNMDSTTHDLKIEIKDLWSAVKRIDTTKNSKTTVIKYIYPKNNQRHFIEKYVNGKLAFIPVD